jgi:hypothetical protein
MSMRVTADVIIKDPIRLCIRYLAVGSVVEGFSR